MPLVSAHQEVTKLSGPLRGTVESANQEYDKQTDPNTPVPSAPVYAARLNGLLKSLANAESAVAQCVKTREGLVLGLEKLLDANRVALDSDRATAQEFLRRKQEIEDKKQQVEVAIMRALGPADGHGSPEEGGPTSPPPELSRPEMEALTPPPTDEGPADPVEQAELPDVAHDGSVTAATTEGSEASHMDASQPFQSVTVSTNGSKKRRRVDDSGEFPDLGGDDGIDADVAEMLKGDSTGS